MTDLIPRALLFGNPERTGVQISPDGQHLSWLAAVEGVLNVWVAPVADLARARPIRPSTPCRRSASTTTCRAG